jgi:endonuclease III-like uncharacterized protein
MDNQDIIEKLFKVQIAVRAKNAATASAIERATIPLLEYEGDLCFLSRSELLKIKGIGQQSADILLKIINGATQYDIVSKITARKKRSYSI